MRATAKMLCRCIKCRKDMQVVVKITYDKQSKGWILPSYKKTALCDKCLLEMFLERWVRKHD